MRKDSTNISPSFEHGMIIEGPKPLKNYAIIGGVLLRGVVASVPDIMESVDGCEIDLRDDPDSPGRWD